MSPIDKLEALHREATPGPWEGVETVSAGTLIQSDGSSLAQVLARWTAADPMLEINANARLIAMSRNIVPQVIDLARAARMFSGMSDVDSRNLTNALNALLRVLSEGEGQ